MKIVFIGAGVAALVTAKKLCEKGFQVVAFERSLKEDLCYDWTDDVSPEAFSEETGVSLPKNRHRKGAWSFYSPDAKHPFRPAQIIEKEDWSIYRRDFSYELLDAVKGDFTVHFGEAVKNLIVENERVVGVETATGRREYADLVIDNSGALSPFRAQVPEKFGIEAKPGKSNVFYAYRGFFKYPEGVGKPPLHTNRVYLKHMGEPGISWCNCSDGEVDVLIGRTEKFAQGQLDVALEDLKGICPEMGGELIKAGKVYIIPVRHPLTRMVADGYVAIGDAAFMTMPLCGSGVQNSIIASCILSEVLIKNPSAKASDLWEYQVRYYKARGANFYGDDVLKHWLLSDCNPDDLNYTFGCGLLTSDIVMYGVNVELPILKLIPKALKLLRRPKFVCPAVATFIRSLFIKAFAHFIPTRYDIDKIRKWEVWVTK